MYFKAVLLFRISSVLFSVLILSSCSPSGPGGLFKKKSPHQVYAQRLRETGLDKTAMGSLWLAEAENSLQKPTDISIPYKETGYFGAEKVEAATFSFEAKRGEQITITLSKKPVNLTIFMDLYPNAVGSESRDLRAYADTLNNPISYEVDEEGLHVLRLQPELLRSGEYTLSIISGPSLAYPIQAPGNNHVKSFWGDGRDANSRKHEGIDLFAKFRTPIVASASGRVTRVNETNIGGKVVWLRPAGKDYSLYYAHLDTQLVADGQVVEVGDTLGLMGNTGNARTTPPHLHFGIYTFGGAVDPLPFVNRSVKKPLEISAPLKNLNATVRTTSSARFFNSADEKSVFQTLPELTTLRVRAASRNWYKAQLPNGQTGYVSNRSVTGVINPVRKLVLSGSRSLSDQPNATGFQKAILSSGQSISILGSFENYYLVTDDQKNTGWTSK